MQLKFLNFLPLIAVAMPAHAQSEAAKAFGSRPVIDVSISPDGKSLALLEPLAGRGSMVSVAPVDGSAKPRPVLVSEGKEDRLFGCAWSSSSRLVCNAYMISAIYGEKRGWTRMLAIDADGGDLRTISARGSSDQLGFVLAGGDVIDWLGGDGENMVLMDRYYLPETTTGNLAADQRRGLGVERVNTRTLARTGVEPPRANAVEYITDGHGNVRVMVTRPTTTLGYGGHLYNYFYRKKDSREWLPLSIQSVSGVVATGFEAYSVDPVLDVVYGAEVVNGRAGIYRISLDGSMKKELVLEQPGIDVHDLIRIGRHQRVVGVSWVTDRRHSVMFDPELKKFAAALAKALPSAPLITFVDSSEDESKLVLLATSDVDPGKYYLFDKQTKKLAEITPIQPALGSYKLAQVQSISYPAADGTAIPAYLTLPPGSDGKGLPAIVMPHGGPWARDEWGFDWLAQFFAHQGYAVLQPNFRGSTGFGAAWLGSSGFKSWRQSIGDINDAGRWLVGQGIAEPSQLAIVGWSYGGYAALQSAVVDPQLYKAIVAIAPVTDIGDLQTEWKGDLSPATLEAMFGDFSVVQAGSPARHADAFVAPVLLVHGDNDQNVSVAESRLMASRLRGKGKSVELIEYKGLDHQLADGEVRSQMLDRSDRFLRDALHLPAAKP